MYIRIYALAVCVQGTYQCPAELLCAVTQLIEALWRGERHTAMSVVRDDVSFWPNLCLSLTRDVMRPQEAAAVDAVTSLSREVLACACILKIVANEVYSHEVLHRLVFFFYLLYRTMLLFVDQ